jgi:hypothetical protein
MKRERREAGISGAFPAWTLAPGTACDLIPAYGNRHVFSRKWNPL